MGQHGGPAKRCRATAHPRGMGQESEGWTSSSSDPTSLTPDISPLRSLQYSPTPAC